MVQIDAMEYLTEDVQMVKTHLLPKDLLHVVELIGDSFMENQLVNDLPEHIFHDLYNHIAKIHPAFKIEHFNILTYTDGRSDKLEPLNLPLNDQLMGRHRLHNQVLQIISEGQESSCSNIISWMKSEQWAYLM